MINDLDGGPTILRNETADGGRWLTVALEGLPPNTDGIGALITVRAGGSSIVFRNACGPSGVMRSASSRMNTLRAAIAGRSDAWRSSSWISSTSRPAPTP